MSPNKILFRSLNRLFQTLISPLLYNTPFSSNQFLNQNLHAFRSFRPPNPLYHQHSLQLILLNELPLPPFHKLPILKPLWSPIQTHPQHLYFRYSHRFYWLPSLLPRPTRHLLPDQHYPLPNRSLVFQFLDFHSRDLPLQKDRSCSWPQLLHLL